MKITLLTLCALLFIAGCKKDDSETVIPTVSGLNYFPDDTGIERFYLADSVIYDEFTNTVDTVSFEIKEVIESKFYDNQNRLTQRIERYRRDSSTGSWEIYQVRAANRNITRVEVVEDNIRYIKLVFSPDKNTKWNGNAMNSLGEQQYKITSADNPNVVGSLSFDSTVTVLQQDDVTQIGRQYAVEKFATGVGNIYTEHVDLAFDFISGVIKSGYQYKERLYSYTIPQ